MDTTAESVPDSVVRVNESDDDDAVKRIHRVHPKRRPPFKGETNNNDTIKTIALSAYALCTRLSTCPLLSSCYSSGTLDVQSDDTSCRTMVRKAMFMPTLDSPVHSRATVVALELPLRSNISNSPTRATSLRGPCFSYANDQTENEVVGLQHSSAGFLAYSPHSGHIGRRSTFGSQKRKPNMPWSFLSCT